MLFEIPKDITDYLGELDAFIEREIKPIQARDDNERFFDHRREHARTDWDNDGLPRHEWEELLREMYPRLRVRLIVNFHGERLLIWQLKWFSRFH